MGSLVKAMTGVFNPLAMPLASSGLIPVWAVVRHRGRRSGRTYSTPIALIATREDFFIPLPWGQGTDWCRNVLAAHGATIRWGGREHPARDPEIVSRSVAAPAFPRPLRAMLPVLGIERVLRLRRGAA